MCAIEQINIWLVDMELKAKSRSPWSNLLNDNDIIVKIRRLPLRILLWLLFSESWSIFHLSAFETLRGDPAPVFRPFFCKSSSGSWIPIWRGRSSLEAFQIVFQRSSSALDRTPKMRTDFSSSSFPDRNCPDRTFPDSGRTCFPSWNWFRRSERSFL